MKSTLRKNDRVAFVENIQKNVLKSDISSFDNIHVDNEYSSLKTLRTTQRDKKKLIQNDLTKVTATSYPDEDNYESLSESEEGSEYDYLLNNDDVNIHAFNQQRMKELHQQSSKSTTQCGIVYDQIPPQNIFEAAGLCAGCRKLSCCDKVRPAAVIHLYEDCRICASLDLCLEEIISTYNGTKFIRSFGRQALFHNRNIVQKSLPQLRNGLPTLIAVKDGVVEAMCQNLSTFINPRNNEIEPSSVENWLNQAGVLLKEVPFSSKSCCHVASGRIDHKKGRTPIAMPKFDVEDLFKCGLPGCQKNFHHEHIGIKNEQQDGMLVREKDIIGKH